MLLRVRGQGASPENSQAALVYLRGFRRTNTQPPPGKYNNINNNNNNSVITAKSLLFPHFHVGIQAPNDTTSDLELNRQLRRVIWKEIWNMYDIVYDELRLFPSSELTTTLLSNCNNNENKLSEEVEFTQLTKRTAAQTTVVVTHYFAEINLQPVSIINEEKDENIQSLVLVLDVSSLPLQDTDKRIAVEIAWAAAYASMQGVLNKSKCIIVRLPYNCNISYTSSTERNALVQEGLDFIGEHLALLTNSFKQKTNNNNNTVPSDISICFIGSSTIELQETLDRFCHSPSLSKENNNTNEKQNQHTKEEINNKINEEVVIFTGDHLLEKQNQQHQTEQLQLIASALDINMRLETVPLKSLIEGEEEPWDAATTRENQVLNFCPCCGHCGGH